MTMMKTGILGATLAASAFVTTVAPATARDHYRYRDRDDTAAVAIGAGVIGLAVGALVASSNNDRYRDGRYYNRRDYRDDGRYYDNRYYNRGYDRDWRRGNRYDRYDSRAYYDNRYYGRRGY